MLPSLISFANLLSLVFFMSWRQVKQKFPQLTTLSPQKGERAVLVKDYHGDYAVLVGRWLALKRHNKETAACRFLFPLSVIFQWRKPGFRSPRDFRVFFAIPKENRSVILQDGCFHWLPMGFPNEFFQYSFPRDCTHSMLWNCSSYTKSWLSEDQVFEPPQKESASSSLSVAWLTWERLQLQIPAWSC